MIRFFFAFLLFFCFTHHASPIYFKHIGVKDGLSQLSVHSIYQDKLGRMWFGTLEGISIYNGDEIINYKDNSYVPGLNVRSNQVVNITGNEKDVFYTTGSNLVRHDLEKGSFHFIRNRITALTCLDGIIYAAAADSLYTWDEEKNKLVFFRKTKLDAQINKIYLDSSGMLWLGTASGLYKGNRDEAFDCIIPDRDISSVFESSTRDLWIATRLEGMFRISPDGTLREFRHDPANNRTISNDHVRTFEEDPNGNIWIGTFDGLNKYDPVSQTFTVYKKDYLKGGLGHSSIFSLLIDKQGILWIGSYYGGVNYFDSVYNRFVYYSEDPKRDDCLNFPFVGNMVEDNNGNLWICTEGGGLNFLNRETGHFKYYTASPDGNSIRHNNLKCIDYDPEHNKLYIGTYTGGLSRLDINSGLFRNYLDYNNSSTEHHRNITSVNVRKDYVIFLDDHGLFKIDKQTDRIEPLFSGSNSRQYSGSGFTVDTQENLWLISNTGVTRIPLNDPLKKKTFYSGQKGLGDSELLSLIETSKGKIFISTKGSGIFLYDEDNDCFISYTANEGQLLSDFCYALAEAPDGNLIISGDKGLSFLNPETGKLIFSATIEKDLPFSALNSGCGIYVTRSGEIYLGSADGLIAFYEGNLMSINDNYELYFAGISVNHKEITPADGTGILNKIPAYTRKIRFNHKQNNFIFSFANNNYLRSSNSSVYEYKLEGFDSEWISTHNTQLRYTNLNPGNYVLKVREQNNSLSTPKEAQLAFVITPPFYKSAIAWLLYILSFIFLLYAFLAFRQKQIKLQASLKYEKKEKEYITNLNKAKLSFFANISHEFRTPLSLITAQLEILLQNNTIGLSIRNEINKIYKNTFDMKNLINELLDFQKLEQKQTHLNVSREDLIPFIQNLFSFFEAKAETQKIRYSFQPNVEFAECWFDPNQLKKVFNNLLSNAFKFSSPGGFIEVLLEVQDELIVIKVVDNGIGIEQKDLSNIFERYYQASNSLLPSQKEFSTGLGLTVSKDIVELHHGTIQVESKLNYGSIFIVTLKKGKKHFENDPNINLSETAEEIRYDILPYSDLTDKLTDPGNIPPHYNTEGEKYKILLVEDNEELLHTLATLFSPLYQIFMAKNGEEGLLLAIDHKPDIIVSDVMMPVMNGDEMCFELKQRIDTCHIPIILLTAQSSTESNMEGLIKGADDYITKPFNSRILLMKCNNMIRNRLLLQQNFQKEPTSTIHLLAGNDTDKKFLQKVEEIITKHISNPDFSIDKLAEEVAMARSSLYSKFKQLTGLTPNDFILNYKLKQAAFLLENKPNMQIVDIAEYLGFSSSRYFSRCFKAEFDVSPMEYRKTKLSD